MLIIFYFIILEPGKQQMIHAPQHRCFRFNIVTYGCCFVVTGHQGTREWVGGDSQSENSILSRDLQPSTDQSENSILSYDLKLTNERSVLVLFQSMGWWWVYSLIIILFLFLNILPQSL